MTIGIKIIGTDNPVFVYQVKKVIHRVLPNKDYIFTDFQNFELVPNGTYIIEGTDTLYISGKSIQYLYIQNNH